MSERAGCRDGGRDGKPQMFYTTALIACFAANYANFASHTAFVSDGFDV